MSKNYCVTCDRHEAADAAKFCSRCGLPLLEEPTRPRCKKCHGEISPSDVYCPYCGEKVKEEKE
jgi:predicted amidophosphoribosyltransferase